MCIKENIEHWVLSHSAVEVPTTSDWLPPEGIATNYLCPSSSNKVISSLEDRLQLEAVVGEGHLLFKRDGSEDAT